MKTVCLYFQIHQPFRLRRYRFFDIGKDHYYYDDYSNESITNKIANRCYLPANKIMLDLIKKYGSKFKFAFSISGTAIDQLLIYAPEVIDSFKSLAETGNVEFLAETYDHSLVSLKDKDEFSKQVKAHSDKIYETFGLRPQVFRNTELIYSDEIGDMVANMGYKAMITEGAKHILGWKSPNFLYCNALNPRLKLLLRNYKLSDDISFRFSNTSWCEHPLTPDKFAAWIKDITKEEETVNIFMDYETFGEHQSSETGIFNFLKEMPHAVFSKTNCTFSTPSEIVEKLQPVSVMSVLHPISWADEERDLTAWLGNDLQNEAFNKLYSLLDKINRCSDPDILQDWKYLQTSDHFYYMCTKFFSDGAVHSYFSPYESPYDAFINYMNVLSDFIIRLNIAVPETTKDQDIINLNKTLAEKEELIKKFEEKLKRFEDNAIKNQAAK